MMHWRSTLLAGFIVAASAIMVVAQDPTGATVVVTLPPDAKVTFDDTVIEGTGATRRFATPALPPGKSFKYSVTVEVVRGGRAIRQTRTVTVRAGETTTVDFAALGNPAPEKPPAADTPAAPAPAKNDGAADQAPGAGNRAAGAITGSEQVTTLEPQVERWDGFKLEGRAVISVQPAPAGAATFGVIWFTANTQVDKEERTVALTNLHINKAEFPAHAGQSENCLALLSKHVPEQLQTIPLDVLEAALAVADGAAKAEGVTVKNEPPAIVHSTTPALLVLIDGEPVLRPVEGSKLSRIINTRNLILFDEGEKKYYLRVMNRWLEATNLDAASWPVAANPPALPEMTLRALRNDTQVDWLNQIAADLKEVFDNGAAPAVYIRTAATELIETKGAPELAAIEGTKILWVKNTPNQLLQDAADRSFYVLLSGRWFRAPALGGPWAYVAADQLPADFASIPPEHPRGDVLSSVAGTPQAEAAVIASRIPQTAVIKRSEVDLEPVFDGEPQFEAIEGTGLRYAVNSPTPIIEVAANSYFAVENGVWFTATAAKGHWTVAKSVPRAIYRIPVWSPIYYVTYAYTYYYDPVLDLVYVGYTPGYFGAYVTPYGVVVFGTGWWYRPWIHHHWWGRAWTYGWGARFAWTPGGWAFGFGIGGGWVWWGPMGWQQGWCRAGMHGGWHTGWGAQYANMHINHLNFANVNIYHRWPEKAHVASTAHAGSPAKAGASSNTIAGTDGKVYRRGDKGWEVHTPQGWRPHDLTAASTAAKLDVKRLDKELAARKTGQANASTYRSAASSAARSGATASTTTGQPVILPPIQRPPPVASRYISPRPNYGYAGFHGGSWGFRSYGGYGGSRPGWRR